MTLSKWCAFTLLAALVGCSGDKLLGPPDAPACTVGGLVAGQTVAGTLSSSSCQVFSEWEFAPEFYESWTMPVQAGHAYLVHLVPDTTAAGDSTAAILLLYARNAGNDPTLSAASVAYSPAGLNSAGMPAEDILFVAPENAVVSIRVETAGNDSLVNEVGAYTLSATECASTPIAANDSATTVTSFAASDCLVHRTADSVRFFYFPFTGAATHSYSAAVIVDSGSAEVDANMAGPAYDEQCRVREDCFHHSATVTDSTNVSGTATTAGQYAAFAVVIDDGTPGAFHVRLRDFGPAPVALRASTFGPQRTAR